MTKNLERKIDDRLTEDFLDWQDMVIFALDDYLLKMVAEMSSDGDIGEMTEDEVHEMTQVIIKRARKSLGKA